jgi:hypothetical protein
MRITDIVVAAAAIGGRSGFLSRPTRARARSATKVRTAQETLSGARASPSTNQLLISMLSARRSPVPPHEFAPE